MHCTSVPILRVVSFPQMAQMYTIPLSCVAMVWSFVTSLGTLVLEDMNCREMVINKDFVTDKENDYSFPRK